MQNPTRTRVKICGITSVEDARYACATGANAIGLVFYQKSPRNVTIQQAKSILDSLPPFVTSVGLFLDAEADFVESVIAKAPLDLLQFHGTETPDYCDSFSTSYIKAIGMADIKNESEFSQISQNYPNAKGFLIDSHATGAAGGTGKTFDWKNVPQNQQKPIILAGGLNPENIADAITQNNLFGVDISSGVESTPGKKDHEKIRKLMTEVNRVQCN